MGSCRVTVQNMRVVRVDPAHHLLLIEGAIPGSEGELVMIRKSVKRPGVIREVRDVEVVAVEEKTATKTKAKAKKK
jgi:hypothetical protein